MTAAELCAEINSLANDDLQPFLGSLVSAQDLWRSVTAEALLDRPMREVIRAHFSSRFKSCNSRAAVEYFVFNVAILLRSVCCLQHRLPDRCFYKACPVSIRPAFSH